MTTNIADEFSDIHRRMREIADEEKAKATTCERCEGAGWEMYGIGVGDPHFKVCEACFNPEGHPSP